MILAYLLMYIILQPVNSGGINLNPHGNVMKYVNKSAIFNCYHSNTEAVTFMWTTNANSTIQSLLRTFRIISGNRTSSTFTITKALYAFNELEIRCQANTMNGDVLYSRKAKLLLQGVLSAVKDLNISINDYSISLTWSAPVTLFESSFVRYLVTIVNMTTSNSSIDVTRNTSYTLMSYNRRIGCDNYMFTITPENSAGLGETQSIYHNNEDLNVTNWNLTLNSVEKLDILLSLTSPLCEVREMFIQNNNLNDTKIKEENFKNFVLITSAKERYQYLLELNLQWRFEYELSMSLNNTNSDVHINFSFSTHSIRNVQIVPYSLNILEIEVSDSQFQNKVFGAFLSLLYCNTAYCDSFNYSNSLYLSIRERGAKLYNLTYPAGHYLVYSCDTSNDGSLLPSINGSCFPQFIRSVNLRYHGASQYYKAGNEQHCRLLNRNNTVITKCAAKLTNGDSQAKKQVILQQNNPVELAFSDPTPIDQPYCLLLKNKISYGVIIDVTNTQHQGSTEPIGRDIVSATDQVSNRFCDFSDPTEDTTTPSHGDGTDIIGIPIGVVFFSVSTLTLLVIVIVIVFKILKRKSGGQILTIHDIDEVYRKCLEVHYKWYELGLELQLSKEDLNTIGKTSDSKWCLYKVLKLCLETKEISSNKLVLAKEKALIVSVTQV